MIRLRHILRPVGTVNSLYRRLRNRLYAQIGPYNIRLAWNSELLTYKDKYHLQDTALGQIAAVVRSKYPSLHAIDIGANVGDTAALIRESGEIPVLCIEGDPLLLKILTENVAQLGSGVAIEPSFVGLDGDAVNLASSVDLGRNACLVQALESQGTVKLRSLQSILEYHPEFAQSKLIKSDTEGFDFIIIQQSLGVIRQTKPLIFFEYDPHFRPDEPRAGINTLEALIGAGYSDFIYFDNVGNFLLHCNASNRNILNDLDCYLGSNSRNGIVVFYFDVCAVHQEDADLIPLIRARTQR